MIAFIKGTVIEIHDNRVVLETGGIGYQIFVSGRDAEQMHIGDGPIRLYTYLQVREDAMQLFGFLNREDREVFLLLLGVNGIGPKAALGILTVFSASDLQFAVLAGDAKTIARAPGIGNKTAQKMILELKDKFHLEDAFEDALSAQASDSGASVVHQYQDEAVQALVALGYPGNEALRAVRSVKGRNSMTTEEILKAALKAL